MFKLSITGAFLVLLLILLSPAGTVAASELQEEFVEAEYLIPNDDLVQYVQEQRSIAQAEVIEHVVSRGETLYRISKRYDVSVASIFQNNRDSIKDPNRIWPGLVLRFPSVDGLFYKVGEEDSVWSLAESFEVELSEIILANGLFDYELTVGQQVVIPGVVSPLPRTNVTASRSLITAEVPALIWPVQGRLTSFFGAPRPDNRRHSGLDIAAKSGTPIKAAAPGRVTVSAWRNGYGYCVIIEHSPTVSTLYAHALKNSLKVKQGDWVEAGDIIALVGSTGNSSAPHLHFEIIVKGNRIDPLRVLRR